MLLAYAPIALTVVANVLYHVFQKVTPAQAHPLLSLAVTYGAAAGVCLLLLPLFPLKDGLAGSFRTVHWASVALGAAVVGLELGFLLAYRAGWNISLAALISNAAVSILLVPVGLWLFREQMSLINLAGVVVCVAGLILINWRQP